MSAALENEFVRRHPVAAAEEIETLAPEQLESAVAGLDPAALVVGLEYLSPPTALAVFSCQPKAARLEILERATPRLATSLLAQMAPAERDLLLAASRASTRKDLERFLSFPDESAGRLMDRSFIAVPATARVDEVLARLRRSRIRGARSIFVTASDGRLEGLVNVQDIALADPDDVIGEAIEPVRESVTVQTGREELVDLLERSRRDSVPVVDAEGRLAGVVRYRNLFRAIEDVATADIQKMVGASAEERALSQPAFAVRRRLPWLHINLLTAFLAAAVVGVFEDLIAQFTALAVLLPVVAGQSGNAGAQALAVTMRGLALREIGIRQWRSVLNKEVRVGLFNGLALALTCGLAVLVWSSSFGLALVIAVAMVMSMLAAGIAGALVPIVLTRAGQDPATASSIILTTVTDVAGFFSFLGTATILAFML